MARLSTSLFVLAVVSFLPFRVADVVIAFAPGAQDTMMVLALALHLDPVFVGALQLSRFLLVSFLVPFLAHRIRKLPKNVKGPHPAGATRPEIEDTQLDR